MLKDNHVKQELTELVILENLVPDDHLVRKIDSILNYKFIYNDSKED